MNIYQTCYDLINEYIFANTLIDGSYEELITILLSSVATIFLFSLPFLVVWKVIKIIVG